MDRRDFLKALGAGTGWLAASRVALASESSASIESRLRALESELHRTLTPDVRVLLPQDYDLSQVLGVRKETLQGRFLRAYRWINIFSQSEREHGLERGVLAGLSIQEGYANPYEVGPTGDAGMFGFLRSAASVANEHEQPLVMPDTYLYGLNGSLKAHSKELRTFLLDRDGDYGAIAVSGDPKEERFNILKSIDKTGGRLKGQKDGEFGIDGAIMFHHLGHYPSENPQYEDYVLEVRRWQLFFNRSRWLFEKTTGGKLNNDTRQEFADLNRNLFNYIGENNSGNDVFLYTVVNGDFPGTIEQRFNAWNRANGDCYKPFSWRSIKRNGRNIEGTIYRGENLFWFAERKEVSQGNFEYKGEVEDGRCEYSWDINGADSTRRLIRCFNRWNAANGDSYEFLTLDDVLLNGENLSRGRMVFPEDTILFHAKPRDANHKHGGLVQGVEVASEDDGKKYVVFPSGLKLAIVDPSVTGVSEEYEDPNNTGVPLLYVPEDKLDAQISTNFTLGEYAIIPTPKYNDGVAIPVHEKGEKTYHQYIRLDSELVSRMQAMRDVHGAIFIENPFRNKTYDAMVRFVYNGISLDTPSKSMHRSGKAVDVKASSLSMLYVLADRIFADGGVGKAATFLHMDTRNGNARWYY